MKDAVRRSIALAVASSLSMCVAAHAATLGPGQSAQVGPADAAEAWVLDNATLTLLPGASALGISAQNNSNLDIDGATLSDPTLGYVLDLISGSSATVRNSTLRSTNRSAATIGADSTALFQNATLEANGMGLNVQRRADVVVTGSRIRATGTGTGGPTADFNTGIGIQFTSLATARVDGGSEIFGQNHGVAFTTFFGTTPGPTGTSALVVDASHVEGATGAAFYVGQYPTRDTAVAADILLQNGSTATGGNGRILETNGNAETRFTADNSRLAGDIVNGTGGVTDVILRNGAALTGVMDNVTRASLDSAAWNMTGNSTVGELSLGNGTVSLGDGAAFHTLNVSGNFTGNDGTLLFNTVLAGDDAASDKLVIGGDTSGTANVRVNNVGGAGAQTNQGIQLIQVGGASNGQFNLAGRAVGGQYEYFLHKGTGTDGNWYLRSVLPTAPDPCEVDPSLPECNPSLPGPDPDPVLRPEPGAYLANLQAAQTLFRLGYHDRHAGQNAGRAWARVDGSRNGFDAVSQQLDIRGNSQALTVGADLWRVDSGSSVGVMLSTGNASSTSTNELTGYYARGKVKGEALGLYGTWRGGNGADPYAGFYVDGSVQRAQFRNRVEGIGLAGERYDSRAWQGAVETGYAFRMGGASNGGIYLEPQLQVGYSRWDDYRHTETNGTLVGTENADGLFGRAGLRLSGVTRWGNGVAEVQPYLAANWLHTRAESQISMDGDMVDARIPRSRGEFSAGASVKFGSGVGVWGGLSLQRASGYHQNAAQVGVSYSW